MFTFNKKKGGSTKNTYTKLGTEEKKRKEKEIITEKDWQISF